MTDLSEVNFIHCAILLIAVVVIPFLLVSEMKRAITQGGLCAVLGGLAAATLFIAGAWAAGVTISGTLRLANMLLL